MADGTVIIFGAGAIRAAGGSRPLARRPPLDCDFFEIAKKVTPALYRRVAPRLNSLVGGYSDEVLRSLESATTLLYLKAIDSAHKSPNHLAFLYQLTLLKRILAATTNDVPVGPASALYRLVRRELQTVDDPEKLTLLTFNYDLTLERVLDELQSHSDMPVFSFPDCYGLPPSIKETNVTGTPPFKTGQNFFSSGISLLKLHGSMNWVSSHNSRRPTPKALFKSNRELTVLNSSRVNLSLSWKRGKRTSYLQPIILPPITGKRGLLHFAMEPVWSAAADALKNARRVVIFGYSCPPLDFEARMLLSENTPADSLKELVVIDPNPEIVGRFMTICGADTASVYSSIQSYHSAA